MITISTKEEVEKLIRYFEMDQIFYLSIKKDGDGRFIMDYKLRQDYNPVQQTRADKILRQSAFTRINIVDNLKRFAEALGENKEIIAFNVDFDCLVDGPKAKSSMNIIYGNGYVSKDKEDIVKDFESLFTDKLNDSVPKIYQRGNGKRYSHVTVEEVLNYLKELL